MCTNKSKSWIIENKLWQDNDQPGLDQCYSILLYANLAFLNLVCLSGDLQVIFNNFISYHGFLFNFKHS